MTSHASSTLQYSVHRTALSTTLSCAYDSCAPQHHNSGFEIKYGPPSPNCPSCGLHNACVPSQYWTELIELFSNQLGPGFKMCRNLLSLHVF